jgi:hypothetical protein
MPAPASASRSVPVCIIPRLLTVLDASKYLSTTTWQIDELVRNNIVPSFILGQRRVIDRLELDRFVDRRAAAFVYAGILHLKSGGGGGIRTPETLSSLTVFKTAAFNHSATPPH